MQHSLSLLYYLFIKKLQQTEIKKIGAVQEAFLHIRPRMNIFITICIYLLVYWLYFNLV